LLEIGIKERRVEGCSVAAPLLTASGGVAERMQDKKNREFEACL
jgi:hypothetical protein